MRCIFYLTFYNIALKCMEFLFSASKIHKQHLNNKALQEIDLNKFLIKNNQSCNQTYQAHPF